MWRAFSCSSAMVNTIFMWSEGGWTGPDYCVAYAIGDSPFGPFKRIGKILEQGSRHCQGRRSSFCYSYSRNGWMVYHLSPPPIDKTDRQFKGNLYWAYVLWCKWFYQTRQNYKNEGVEKRVIRKWHKFYSPWACRNCFCNQFDKIQWH